MDTMYTNTTTAAERLLPTVRQVMRVTDYSSGGGRLGYEARFRGQLVLASDEAYDRLKPAFDREGLTLLLRAEGEAQVVLAAPAVKVRPSNWRVNLILGILTILSLILAGELYAYDGPLTLNGLARGFFQGLPFAVSMMGILMAHEFGHYLAARYHKTAVTLPYFLPFPGSPFGTLGAFIQLKQPPRNRRVLMDIGLAGPLAGMVIAVPVLLYGLAQSNVGHLPSAASQIGVLEGNSLLYLGAKFLAKGQLLPAPASYGGMSPLIYWIRYFFLGLPAPLGGTDVMLNQVAWAGWAGLLVTALNLIPAGQLDGGHLMYVLLGRRTIRLWPFLLAVLVLLGFVWPGWFLWAFLIYFLGRTYAQPLDELTPLDTRRKLLAVAGLILFVLVFSPVPLRTF
ncbi:MAG: site-2 protease family protein [Actinobacteria bacterium]|nr:site-2 protease family protein [Actinomycetota bacterium]